MFWSKKSRLASNEEVISMLRTLSLKVQTLEQQLELLGAQHKSLRGYTYGKFGRMSEGEEPAKAETSSTDGLDHRDKLRVLAGIKPGKPYKHS